MVEPAQHISRSVPPFSHSTVRIEISAGIAFLGTLRAMPGPRYPKRHLEGFSRFQFQEPPATIFWEQVGHVERVSALGLKSQQRSRDHEFHRCSSRYSYVGYSVGAYCCNCSCECTGQVQLRPWTLRPPSLRLRPPSLRLRPPRLRLRAWTIRLRPPGLLRPMFRYPGDSPNNYPVGTKAWWRAMERDGRTGTQAAP